MVRLPFVLCFSMAIFLLRIGRGEKLQYVSEYQLLCSNGRGEVCLSLLFVGFPEATGEPLWEAQCWTGWTFGQNQQIQIHDVLIYCQCADIIGGIESHPHSKPFMALIPGKTYCGGTLVKPDWVLTAAHCKLGRKTSIILGAHSISERESTKQNFSIIKRFPHPGFNPKTKENDLMLLKLNKPAKITPAVKPLTLPKTYKDPKAGTKCLVAGWGITANGQNKPSDTLREVNVTVINRRICNDRNHYNSDPPVTMNMVCAGDDKKGRKDSCTGDSGGPLICKGKQTGIVSFGREEKCGDPQYPGVYTALTKEYLSWISRIMKGDQ